MKHFKEKLEIETLKALTYTQINELLNKLTLENKELKEQLRIGGVSKSLKTKKELTIGEYFSDYKKDSKIYQDYTSEEVNGISDFIHGYILAKQKL